jgi:hypothetical protein
MSIWRLVSREIRYRSLDSLLGVAAVMMAVACLVAVTTLLRGHEQRITAITEESREGTLSLMRQVEDDYRKITTKLGYNVLVLHKDQDLAEFHAQGFASKYMPENFVYELAKSESMTVRHLLPTLHESRTWPEQDDLDVVVIGVRNEIPQTHLNPKKPLLEPVPKGAMRIGHVLQQKTGISVGDTVTFRGKSFTVDQTHGPRGNADDITLWIHLEEAQALFDREGQMNALMALSCHCDEASLAWIEDEFKRLLPETQILQLATEFNVREQARDRAEVLNVETAEDLVAQHAALRAQRESFAAWAVPTLTLGAVIWVALLALGNVRARTAEIGLWRALGLRTSQILGIFLSKALVLGLVGAVVGSGLGLVLGLAWSSWEGVAVSGALLHFPTLVGVLVAAPVLSMAASWLPALSAAQQDPADVLRRD